jgi:hypothetical protein
MWGASSGRSPLQSVRADTPNKRDLAQRFLGAVNKYKRPSPCFLLALSWELYSNVFTFMIKTANKMKLFGVLLSCIWLIVGSHASRSLTPLLSNHVPKNSSVSINHLLARDILLSRQEECPPGSKTWAIPSGGFSLTRIAPISCAVLRWLLLWLIVSRLRMYLLRGIGILDWVELILVASVNLPDAAKRVTT